MRYGALTCSETSNGREEEQADNGDCRGVQLLMRVQRDVDDTLRQRRSSVGRPSVPPETKAQAMRRLTLVRMGSWLRTVAKQQLRDEIVQEGDTVVKTRFRPFGVVSGTCLLPALA